MTLCIGLLVMSLASLLGKASLPVLVPTASARRFFY
jgi:hypothetical protein